MNTSCAAPSIAGLPVEGGVAGVGARLRAYLATLDPTRPVICLHPGPLRRRAGERAGPRVPRPAPHEYAAGFAAEIALVPDAPDFAAMLLEQLDVTRSLAITFDEANAGPSYASGKWTVREVVGHIADCERVLSYRLLRILRGDATPVPGFDHEGWVPAARFETRPLMDVMRELAAVRAATAALVRAATAALVRAAAPGDFAGGLPVGIGGITGRGLAYLIAGHERHHQEMLRTRYLPCLPAITS